MTPPVQSLISPALLTQLDTEHVPTALALLEASQLATPEVAAALVEIALERAEASTRSASHWLAVASALTQAQGEDPAFQAQIRYAQARIHLQQGDLQKAEQALREAQARWHSLDDGAALARSYLGLTQILALQGHFDQAEDAIRQAIARLPAESVQLAWAYENLANLRVRRGDYSAALESYHRAHAILSARLATSSDEQLRQEIATVDLNQANVLVALDQPHEAESLYQRALAYFDSVGDALNRGRIKTNLGSLFLRTGRYAAAMELFISAESDLLGDALLLDQSDPDLLRQADILLLDQANAYLALNLLSEATHALNRCQQLFRSADQPYELAQSLYLLGLLHLRTKKWESAESALITAHTLFSELANHPWRDRVNLALAILAAQRGDAPTAIRLLDTLLRRQETTTSAWDLSTAVEARLLRVQLFVDAGEIAPARAQAVEIEEELAHFIPLPHLHLRLEGARGTIELAARQYTQARQHFYRALEILEDQRTSLPLEEFRTAYLVDKFHIYGALLCCLLDGSSDPSAETVDEAFGVMERARSRALLERLQTTLPDRDEVSPTQSTDPSQPYRRLHWLYNQLLGSAAPHAQHDAELRAYESALERMAWKSAQPLPNNTLFQQARPATLTEFQASLAADQQALLYYVVEGQQADGEVLAFLIDRTRLQVFRHLCTPAQLNAAQDELRFHMGRAELGDEYMARHGRRLIQGLQGALHTLYGYLIAPMTHKLLASRLLILPHGSLHLLPFHALWDGTQYLLERFTCTYAPSASVAVHCAQDRPNLPYQSLAGLALADPDIPQAQREVTLAAHHFDPAWLYLGEDANRAGLMQAAQQADVLHIATHGLFRPDNPFFSALKLADGWIDVRSLYTLPLRARLVVLSACESGTANIHGGDEVIGLARGFLGAGARDLLVSLWNVHDARSVELMTAFYQHLVGGQDPAGALCSAQKIAIAQGQHPYFWASFLAIGA